MEIRFANPIYLWFLISIILLVIVHFYTLKHTKKKALKFANFEAIARVTGGEVLTKNLTLLFVRVSALAFAVLAIAGTTLYYTGETSNYNFVLALDASSSMTADDFQPDRFEAAKVEAIRFVDSIKTKTKIGVVSFSGTSFVEKELTDDYIVVKETINNIQIKEVGGTDLGEAIVTSTNILNTDNKAKVIILLTDGRSNVGTPLEDAITYANEKYVKIHTIGIGTEEGGKIAGIEAVSTLDEESLRNIALATEGNYYRATDEFTLGQAYQDIIEQTKQRLTLNLSPILMLLAILLLFTEWALLSTKYRTLP